MLIASTLGCRHNPALRSVSSTCGPTGPPGGGLLSAFLGSIMQSTSAQPQTACCCGGNRKQYPPDGF
ncbi:hypothetical protein VTI74DRAFT_1195 [Chaetomium olivicolor]